jgi:hypothetical protein
VLARALARFLDNPRPAPAVIDNPSLAKPRPREVVREEVKAVRPPPVRVAAAPGSKRKRAVEGARRQNGSGAAGGGARERERERGAPPDDEAAARSLFHVFASPIVRPLPPPVRLKKQGPPKVAPPAVGMPPVSDEKQSLPHSQG